MPPLLDLPNDKTHEASAESCHDQTQLALESSASCCAASNEGNCLRRLVLATQLSLPHNAFRMQNRSWS